MPLETIYFPVALSLHFIHSDRSKTRRFNAHSLHSFRVEKRGNNSAILTAPDGAIAYGVHYGSFERLPAGYSWVKFKENHVLATAKRRSNETWDWQPETSAFVAGRVYAIKMLPPDAGQTDSCNLQTKDRKIFPYVDRRYFSVAREKTEPSPLRVLEAYPLPVPGNQSGGDSNFWESPREYDSIPVVLERHVDGFYKSSTVSPVAALRLEFDDDKNPVYKCSYFGPALK